MSILKELATGVLYLATGVLVLLSVPVLFVFVFLCLEMLRGVS